MSNQVYFGKSVSSGDTNKKIVYMKEMPEHFNEGDLLAVFFTHRNTASTPSIVFKVGSTQQEVSVADDEGILIKSHDVDVEKEGLWGNGETVLFCFVKRPDNNGILYLEIIGKLQASEDDYGIVKLNGISADETLEEWLQRDETADDYNAAINTATVKALIKTLFSIQDKEEEEGGGGEEEEEEKQPISFNLQWVPNSELTEELYPLGQLSLGNSGDPVYIGIPKNLITQKLPEYTGELINNGSDGINVNGEPYITRHIPNDLFFEPGDMITPEENPRTYLPGNGIALEGAKLSRIIQKEDGTQETRPENTIPYHIRFDKDKLVLGHNESADFNKVIIRPALEVDGTANIANTLNCADNIVGSKNISGNKLISAVDITEKGDLLRNRYSGKLKVIQLVSAGQVIPVKSYKRYLLKWTGGTAWRPIGIVGYNADSMDTKNSGDVLWANIWECFVINTAGTSFYPKTDNNVSGATNDVQVAITNLNTSKSINVRVTVYVLCEKVL